MGHQRLVTLALVSQELLESLAREVLQDLELERLDQECLQVQLVLLVLVAYKTVPELLELPMVVR